MSDFDEVRCSQADRDAVEEVLRSAFQDGRLDPTEFEERLERLHVARTYRDLGTLVTDVPHSLPFLPPVTAPGALPVVQEVPADVQRRRRLPVLRTLLLVYLAVLVIGTAPWMMRPVLLMVVAFVWMGWMALRVTRRLGRTSRWGFRRW